VRILVARCEIAYHGRAVTRLGAGDPVILFNGAWTSESTFLHRAALDQVKSGSAFNGSAPTLSMRVLGSRVMTSRMSFSPSAIAVSALAASTFRLMKTSQTA
jgi:hypothetical protein